MCTLDKTSLLIGSIYRNRHEKCGNVNTLKNTASKLLYYMCLISNEISWKLSFTHLED